MTRIALVVRSARSRARLIAMAVALLVPAGLGAQTSAPPTGQMPSLRQPPITVTARKEPSDLQDLPVSVTALTSEVLERAGIRAVGEAALLAPNTYFSELSARRVSNARFRGIGSSPANPGIATIIDGVPQLNTSASSVELVDTAQIEFVRGGQSALFGRNALGGVINVTSRQPSFDAWTGGATVPFANADGRGLRARLSGPLQGDTLALSLALGYDRRDGFTSNLVTGSIVDDRSAFYGKAQVMWRPTGPWQARLIVSGERDRDGDYTLGDLDALRADPFQVARDFDGRTDRDVVNVTALTRREGSRLTFTSSTGVVSWRTHDVTDLDYGPMPLATRDNREDAVQFTQEVRVASAADVPVRVGSRVLRWQAGAFLFTQSYAQDAVNGFAPYLLSPFVTVPVDQHAPESTLDDVGIGVFGEATLSVTDRLDVSGGVRVDHESKEAALSTYFVPAIQPMRDVTVERSFSAVSPQVAVSYDLETDRTVYASVGRGFKAGGFNPASPAGSEAYGEERAWHTEGGIKSRWGGQRATVNAAVFFIDWTDLQLNLPDPSAPGQFYIANVGGATSAGVEIEASVRVLPRLDVFTAIGQTASRFKAGSISLGVDVSDNRLPGTPDYTAMFGAETSAPLGPGLAVFGRAETVFYGAFKYNDANTVGQDAYALTNLRAGLETESFAVEFWIRNAFDTRYIPVAFDYANFAPSGFVGEPGLPRRFGVSGRVRF